MEVWDPVEQQNRSRAFQQKVVAADRGGVAELPELLR
jgi:hypothetical protein